MKVLRYDVSEADAFVWRTMTREQLVGETAMCALANMYGQISWACPWRMRPKPSVHILRALQGGLTDAEVFEVQTVWACFPELRDDNGRVLNPTESEDDALAISRFLVTPSRQEIESAMAAVARGKSWAGGAHD